MSVLRYSVVILMSLFFSINVFAAKSSASGFETQELVSDLNSSSNGDKNYKDTILSFMIITDLHIDTFNSPTQECVRGVFKKRVPMQINPKKICEGSPRQNDSDPEIFKKMLTAIKHDIDEVQPVEFLVVLGDFAGHARPRKDKKFTGNSIRNDIETGYRLTQEILPNVPKFYVYGNNDTLGDIPNARFHIDDPKLSGEANSPYEIAMYKETGWVDGFLSTGVYCGRTDKPQYLCLIPGAVNRKEAYYAAYIRSNLKLIALNTVIMSWGGVDELSKMIAKKEGIAQDEAKPKARAPSFKELEWFKKQLEDVRKKGEKIIIVMHNPPGKNTCSGYDSLDEEVGEKLTSLLQEYDNEIITIMAGHDHHDQFKLLVDSAGNIAEDMVIIAPAMSSADANSPGLKYFFLKKEHDAWELDSHETLRFSRLRDGQLSLRVAYDFALKYCTGKSYDELDDCLEGISEKALIKSIMKDFTLRNPNANKDVRIKKPGAIYIEVEDVKIPDNVFNRVKGADKLLSFSKLATKKTYPSVLRLRKIFR